MPATHVLALHDDDRWYRARLLDQHRSGGRWRAVVRYSVSSGMQYARGVWADLLRAVDNPPAGGADPREDESVLPPAAQCTPGGPVTRPEHPGLL